MAAWARGVDGGRNDSAGKTMALDVAVFDLDGRDCVSVSVRGPADDPDGLGCHAVQLLRSQGADKLLARVN